MTIRQATHSHCAKLGESVPNLLKDSDDFPNQRVQGGPPPSTDFLRLADMKRKISLGSWIQNVYQTRIDWWIYFFFISGNKYFFFSVSESFELSTFQLNFNLILPIHIIKKIKISPSPDEWRDFPSTIREVNKIISRTIQLIANTTNSNKSRRSS